MTPKETAAFVEALKGDGAYAHLNTPAARKVFADMNQQTPPPSPQAAEVAQTVTEAGKKRRGEK